MDGVLGHKEEDQYIGSIYSYKKVVFCIKYT